MPSERLTPRAKEPAATTVAERFSPVISEGALRLPLVTRGKTEESATRSPSTPITRPSGSTTAPGSSGEPIRQVPQGW
jgi:hypothetical protein